MEAKKADPVDSDGFGHDGSSRNKMGRGGCWQGRGPCDMSVMSVIPAEITLSAHTRPEEPLPSLYSFTSQSLQPQ